MKTAIAEPTVTILNESVNVVDVAFRFYGLKTRGWLNKWLTWFTEQPTPDKFFKNANFSLWSFSSRGLQMDLTVKESDQHETNYRYLINQFPCEVDVLRSKVKATQSYDKTHSFLILSLYKKEPGCDWKTYIAMHGRLDVE